MVIWAIVWLGSSGQITKSLFFPISEKMSGNISLQRHHTLPQEGIWSCFTKLLFTTGCTGFSGFPGPLTQTQEGDICQSWACWAVWLTELPASPAEPSAATGNKPVSDSTSAAPTHSYHTTLMSPWTGISWCNSISEADSTLPKSELTLSDWHIRQQTVREIE